MPADRLASLPVFAGVETEKLRRLEAAAEERGCHPNEIVYRTGDPCDGLYVIVRGAVLFRAERVGQPVERVKELDAGEVFGEKEIFAGAPRELSIRAVGETALLRIPLEPLRRLLAEAPVLETVLRTLSIRRRSAQLRASLSPSSRREARIWVDRTVLVTTNGGERFHAHLEDLSPGGACLAGVPAAWRGGGRLSLSLGLDAHPGLLHLSAEVRWRQRDSVGLAFEGPGAFLRKAVEQALRVLVVVG
jgi:CRP-like cAMP-binding protein